LTEVICPSCGTPNPSGFRFCGACGEAMERRCPSCGAANPAGFLFCGECGASLAPEALPDLAAEERKVVTALFADLTASTEMAARLDPEDLRGVLRPFFDAMAQEITRFGGTVEKFIGDAIVAFFGVPVAHEDDPERAVRAALAMQRRLAELNRDLAQQAGGDLAMRVGVNTGEVFSHGGGNDEGFVTGEAVNVAARFQTLASPGTVVVGERTFRGTRRSFVYRPLGDVDVKGIERPLPAWEAQGELVAPRAAEAPTDAPFVGRGSEMELLRLLFARTVSEGTPNLVTVIGPPGIGKSRLSLEVARAAGPDATRIVRGRCLPYGDGLTYWPLAEILKADAAILDSDPPDVILDKARARLDPRFPGEDGLGVTSVLLSSIGVDVSPDPLAGTERGAAQRMIARSWQRYFESMTADGPLIALLEDIHWADASLLELIESVVSRASGPAFVLCTSRPELLERRPDWGGGLTNATSISLSPLSHGEGTTLIEHLLGGDAPPEVIGPILGRSEGNPFFAGELLRMMTEDGTLARRDGRWHLLRELPSALPDTVQGVIASRIDLLTPIEKRVIQDASVIGRIFWPGAVARLSTTDTTAALDALIDKGLVHERAASSLEGERELIFHHVLTRDVAYAGIPHGRRADAHAVVGVWAEEVMGGRLDEFSEILAHHFGLAGDRERTARYALLAGSRQSRVFAAEQAIEWFDRALVAVPDGDVAVGAEISLGRGRALEQLGRYTEAQTDYERASVGSSGAGDAVLEARCLAALAHVLWLLDRYDEGDALLPVALARARAVGAADIEARLLYTAGTIRFGRAEFTEALGFHEEALRVATESGDREGQALAHHGLCESYFFLASFERSLEHGQRADSLLRELGQKPMVAHNAYMVSWALWSLGRASEGLAVVESSIAGSREIGNRRDEAFALYSRAEILLSLGRMGEALADAELGLSIFRELDLPRGEIVGLNVTSDVLGELRQLDRFVENAGEALQISDAFGIRFQRADVVAAVGWGALVLGDREGAENYFQEAHDANAAPLDLMWSGRTEVLAWEWAGDIEGLEKIGARLTERFGEPRGVWGIWGGYASALAASLAERWTEASELSRALLDEAESCSELSAAWRLAAVAARSMRALGRADEAEGFRARGAAILRPIVDSVPDDLRSTFIAHPAIGELLAVP
jgi:class 3 adenylate cyclase/tetratricopeptide (TPR) repeat protein